MKRILLFTFILLIRFAIYAQLVENVLVNDNYIDSSKYVDNSLLLLWGDNANPTSAFELKNVADTSGLSYKALSVTPVASIYSTYATTVNGKPSLLTSTCYDYEFPTAVNHARDTLIIEFDVLWDKYDSFLYGEYGRMVVFLMDELPAGGAKYNDIYNVANKPFGVPKYNLRIRNGLPVSTGHPDYNLYSPTFMLYGGGHDIEGEFEKNGDKSIWFPGFSSEAGGGSPGQPTNSDYPTATATKKSDKSWSWVASTQQWKHITWVVEPELLKLYSRASNQDSTYNMLISKMSIPKDSASSSYIINKINAEHGTSISSLPLDYNWFPTFNSMRIYFRAWKNNLVHVANVKVVQHYNNQFYSSIANNNALHVNVFPNPASKYIQVTSNMVLTDLKLIDMRGDIVKCQQINNSVSTLVNLNGLSKGVYVIIVSSINGIQKSKIYIQ